MSRTAFIAAPIITLVAGLSIGTAASTLLWQGPLERRGQLLKDALAQTEQALAIAATNLQTAKSCTAALTSLTTSVQNSRR